MSDFLPWLITVCSFYHPSKDLLREICCARLRAENALFNPLESVQTGFFDLTSRLQVWIIYKLCCWKVEDEQAITDAIDIKVCSTDFWKLKWNCGFRSNSFHLVDFIWAFFNRHGRKNQLVNKLIFSPFSLFVTNTLNTLT